MHTLLIRYAIVTISILLFSFDTPKSWFEAGSQRQSYDMGIEIGAGKNGDNVATIQSKKSKINGFGTLMQNCLPDKYLGKRVRMSGFMKTEDVEGWAGFWFRVDGKNMNHSLSFDNMKDRAISGTTDWKQYEIVLDVPLKSSNLAYGALLSGTGQIWFDNIQFEVVDKSILSTSMDKVNFMPLDAPTNLNFEK